MKTIHRILLIDDEEANVRVLSMSLRVDGYEVLTAFSGEEGIETFKEGRPDIVITDIKMPGMDGLEVLRQVKELNPEAQVIIITGHGDIDSAIEALQHGASDFINKPIRDKDISIALRRAVEKIEIRRKLKEYTEDLEAMVQIATEEVRRKVDFQDRLIRSSNDGIIATDEEWRIIVYNPGAERIFGYPRNEVIRKKDFFRLYPREIVDALLSDSTGPTPYEALPWKEFVIAAKDGQEIPVRCSGTLLYDEGAVIGSVTFFQDLREIKRLQKELIKSERLAAIGQTVAGLAHYIKNILHGLKGGGYVVNVGLARNDISKLRQGWQSIEKNIGRISDLVWNLLTYSKERAPEFRTCNPNEIAGEAFELMEATARENRIEMVKEFDDSMPEMSVDPRTIHRCLLNLISNAIDACAPGDGLEPYHRIVVRTARTGGDGLRFEVQDNGSGMSDDVKERLFSPFFSTKGDKGTGLGLLVTHKLVQEHGGTIRVSSRPGEGTVFTVEIPSRRPSVPTGVTPGDVPASRSESDMQSQSIPLDPDND